MIHSKIPQVPFQARKRLSRRRRLIWLIGLGLPALFFVWLVFAYWWAVLAPGADILVRNFSGEDVEIVELEFDGKIVLRNHRLTKPFETFLYGAGKPAQLRIAIRRGESGEIEQVQKQVRGEPFFLRTIHSVAIRPTIIEIGEWDMDTGGPFWD